MISPRLPATLRAAVLRTLGSPRTLVILALLALALVLAACAAPAGSPGASGSAGPTPTPQGAVALVPASPGANPVDLLAALFTPIFQAFFITLVLFYELTGNIAIAIILLTVVLRVLLIPLYRRQLVSTKRMQLVQPEIRELTRRFKGDRAKQQEATMRFYRERGINPASGCLPIILQFILIIPMYTVISQGLTNYNPQAMLDVGPVRIVDLHCPATPTIVMDQASGQPHAVPCLQTVTLGVDWGKPEVIVGKPGGFLSGLSLLAVISALVQLVASRMTLPPAGSGTDDQNTRLQRQMAYLFPFISLSYGSLLPAGLFLYWIVGTIIQIVQQYFILGWGGMFPLFGWYPEFARNHTPRFPVSVPAPLPPEQQKQPSGRGAPQAPTGRLASADERAASAARTIRPSTRNRSGRRGRRR